MMKGRRWTTCDSVGTMTACQYDKYFNAKLKANFIPNMSSFAHIHTVMSGPIEWKTKTERTASLKGKDVVLSG
jgi:hypothetical protein